MARINRFLVIAVVFVLLAITGTASAQNQNAGHCVVHLNTNGSSVFKGCYTTLAQAINFATGGNVNLSDNASLSEVDAALRERDALQEQNRLLSPMSAQGVGIQRCCTVIAIMYDWMNYQSNSITHTASSSSGCIGVNYLNPNYGLNPYPGGGNWDNKIESAVTYANCNYAVVYDNTNYGGSLNGCASPCSTMGALNNNVSSSKIQRYYP